MTSHASQTAGYMGSGASLIGAIGAQSNMQIVVTYPGLPNGWSAYRDMARCEYIIQDDMGGLYRVSDSDIHKHGHPRALSMVLQSGIGHIPVTGHVTYGTTGGTVSSNGRHGFLSPPHSPTTLKSEGVRAGEIIAYRSWRVSYDGDGQPVLTGSFKTDAKWPYDKPMEGDAAGGYGVHAYKSMDGAIDDNYYDTKSTDSVFGEVLLWGDIIEHDHGYRAQYGMLHKILLSSFTLRVNGIVDKIKELYARSDRQSSVE